MGGVSGSKTKIHLGTKQLTTDSCIALQMWTILNPFTNAKIHFYFKTLALPDNAMLTNAKCRNFGGPEQIER